MTSLSLIINNEAKPLLLLVLPMTSPDDSTLSIPGYDFKIKDESDDDKADDADDDMR